MCRQAARTRRPPRDCVKPHGGGRSMTRIGALILVCLATMALGASIATGALAATHASGVPTGAAITEEEKEIRELAKAKEKERIEAAKEKIRAKQEKARERAEERSHAA